ncbi:type VII secretion protein EccE [Brachybacterium horti]
MNVVEVHEETTARSTGTGAARRVKFPQHERGGFMWGLQLPQFVVVGVVIVSVVGLLMLQQLALAGLWAIVAVPVGVIAAITWKGRPLMYRIWSATKWRTRVILGETRWRTSEAPVPAGTMELPGDVGIRLSVHATKWGGAITYDARAQRATAVIRCESQGWDLASDSDRSERAYGFAKLCQVISRAPAVDRVVTMARTIPSETTAARKAHESVVQKRAVDDPWGENVMNAVFTGREFVDGEGKLRGPEDQKSAVSRDTLLAISVSVPRAQKQIRSYGGGLQGAAEVLSGEIDRFRERVKETGVTHSEWLTPAQLGDVNRLAIDLDATEILARTVDDRDQDRFNLGVALLVDDADPEVLVTNGGVHSTFWISEWPRTEVPLGFLQDLICTGDFPMTVTQVFTTESTGAALRQVGKSLDSIESKFDINRRLQRRTSILDRRAVPELQERENELADGHVSMRIVGYVRVSGRDRDELAVNEDKMHAAAPNLDLQRLKHLQWEGFVASSLPVGWGL